VTTTSLFPFKSQKHQT